MTWNKYSNGGGVPPMQNSAVPKADAQGQGPIYGSFQGGIPQQHADQGQDVVDGKLRAGEFVFKPEAVKAIGVDNLSQINDSYASTQRPVPAPMGDISNPSMSAPVQKVKKTDRYGNSTEITFDTKAGDYQDNGGLWGVLNDWATPQQQAVPVQKNDGGTVPPSRNDNVFPMPMIAANGGPVYAADGGWFSNLVGGLFNDDEDQNAGYANYTPQDFVNEANKPNSVAANTGYEVPATPEYFTPQFTGQFDANHKPAFTQPDGGVSSNRLGLAYAGTTDVPSPDAYDPRGELGAKGFNAAVVKSVAPMSDEALIQSSSQNTAPILNDIADTALTEADTNNNMVNETAQYIAGHEGFETEAYQDQAGVWTIGYGRTRNDDGSAITPGQTTAQGVEDQWLANRTQQEVSDVEAYGQKYGYQWSPQEAQALASFKYNIGNLDQLTANGTRSKAEILEAMTQYNKAGGKVSEGLVNRRNDEAALFGSSSQGGADSSGVPPVDAGIPKDTRVEDGFIVDNATNEIVGNAPLTAEQREALSGTGKFGAANATGISALDSEIPAVDEEQGLFSQIGENIKERWGFGDVPEIEDPLDAFGGEGRTIPPKPVSTNPADFNIEDQAHADDILRDTTAPNAMRQAAQAFNRERDRSQKARLLAEKVKVEALSIEAAKVDGTLTQSQIDRFETTKASAEKAAAVAAEEREAELAITTAAAATETAEIEADTARQTYNPETGNLDAVSVDEEPDVKDPPLPAIEGITLNTKEDGSVSATFDGRTFETREAAIKEKAFLESNNLDFNATNGTYVNAKGDQVGRDGGITKTAAQIAAELETKTGDKPATVKSLLKDTFADLLGISSGESFGKELAASLVKAFVLYAGARLTGSSGNAALAFAAKTALAQGEAKTDALASRKAWAQKELDASDYTPKSVQKYIKSGNTADLMPAAAAGAILGDLTTKSVWVPGSGRMDVYETDKGDAILHNGKPIIIKNANQNGFGIRSWNEKFDPDYQRGEIKKAAESAIKNDPDLSELGLDTVQIASQINLHLADVHNTHPNISPDKYIDLAARSVRKYTSYIKQYPDSGARDAGIFFTNELLVAETPIVASQLSGSDPAVINNIANVAQGIARNLVGSDGITDLSEAKAAVWKDVKGAWNQRTKAQNKTYTQLGAAQKISPFAAFSNAFFVEDDPETEAIIAKYNQ